ncbi:MAG: biotin--protein ligase [Micavibrio aeruginosavorus]|uniref:Biotin--protein ligase n=1 Tax=Micavibrio aeruginosavorus TaxID=349221 RepID=A0A2W5HFQ3_9BACT|nr:MAG: biotin--protein ligase [Micavibrio aeruginosavorus]
MPRTAMSSSVNTTRRISTNIQTRFSMTRKRSKVFLYQDYVHNNGVLHKRLCETYGSDNVRFCDAADIISGALNESVFLFVMPGGADLYYCEKLNGEGNTKIKAYVEQGGNYLGICAGAYYAAREIDWNKGEIAGSRELAFANAKATGPVYEFLEENDINKSWQNIVDVTIDGERYSALYAAGPVFEGDGLATYSNGQTAIVKNTIGKGTVILSSPHIEYAPKDLSNTTYKHLNTSTEWSTKNIDRFTQNHHSERDLWSRVTKEFA